MFKIGRLKTIHSAALASFMLEKNGRNDDEKEDLKIFRCILYLFCRRNLLTSRQLNRMLLLELWTGEFAAYSIDGQKYLLFCWLGHLKMSFYYPTSHMRARGSILLVHYSMIVLKPAILIIMAVVRYNHTKNIFESIWDSINCIRILCLVNGKLNIRLITF